MQHEEQHTSVYEQREVLCEERLGDASLWVSLLCVQQVCELARWKEGEAHRKSHSVPVRSAQPVLVEVERSGARCTQPHRLRRRICTYCTCTYCYVCCTLLRLRVRLRLLSLAASLWGRRRSGFPYFLPCKYMLYIYFLYLLTSLDYLAPIIYITGNFARSYPPFKVF